MFLSFKDIIINNLVLWLQGYLITITCIEDVETRVTDVRYKCHGSKNIVSQQHNHRAVYNTAT